MQARETETMGYTCDLRLSFADILRLCMGKNEEGNHLRLPFESM